MIVFRAEDGSHTMVKRVIGLPGDEIEVVGHLVSINGEWADYDLGAVVHAVRAERYANDAAPLVAMRELTRDHPHTILAAAMPTATQPVHLVVPPGHVFVLGDNRMHSRDSRDFGTVPIDRVLGRVYSVAMSIDPDAPLAVNRERWFISVH